MQIIRQQEDRFEKEVQGLIEICKSLSENPDKTARDIVYFIPWNPHVVIEARARVLKTNKKI